MDTTLDRNCSVHEMRTNLDLYGLVEDMAQNPGTQSQRVEVSMPTLSFAYSQENSD